MQSLSSLLSEEKAQGFDDIAISLVMPLQIRLLVSHPHFLKVACGRAGYYHYEYNYLYSQAQQR